MRYYDDFITYIKEEYIPSLLLIKEKQHSSKILGYYDGVKIFADLWYYPDVDIVCFNIFDTNIEHKLNDGIITYKYNEASTTFNIFEHVAKITYTDEQEE